MGIVSQSQAARNPVPILLQTGGTWEHDVFPWSATSLLHLQPLPTCWTPLCLDMAHDIDSLLEIGQMLVRLAPPGGVGTALQIGEFSVCTSFSICMIKLRCRGRR